MDILATINTFTLSSERHEEEDRYWDSWELHNSDGKRVSSRVWMVINNIRDERTLNAFTFDQIVSWINQNVGPSDFRK